MNNKNYQTSMKNINAVYRLGFCLLLTCATLMASVLTHAKDGDRPQWIDEPGDGAVGYSTYHVKGRAEQQALAIARARTELAARLGVAVSSVHNFTQVVANEQTTVRSTQATALEIKETIVRARVREYWRDPKSDELWVWLYPED